MKDEALKLALEALESVLANHNGAPVLFWIEARDAVKQALAAPVQEPVWNEADELQCPICKITGRPYPKCGCITYAAPPAAQRQWVGLTDEAIWSEYQTLWPFHPAEEPKLAKDIAKFARAIEAKLKENT
jgi:hypothetical protein